MDCLACHDTTGAYKKVFPEVAPDPKVDLTKVAQNVGRSSRKSCGSCHFYGGGGDHIKHGDLDSSMTDPTAEIDVHMGGNAKMTCTDCHKTKDHLIRGESLLVSQGDKLRVQCTDCHSKPEIHKNAALDRHAKKVACQTCHIPTIARTLPTKVWWDWSKAGQDLKPEKDAFGMETYAKIKGEFKWNKDFAPEYFWYNGKVDRSLPGDKIDPSKVVEFNRPLGNGADKTRGRRRTQQPDQYCDNRTNVHVERIRTGPQDANRQRRILRVSGRDLRPDAGPRQWTHNVRLELFQRSEWKHIDAWSD